MEDVQCQEGNRGQEPTSATFRLVGQYARVKQTDKQAAIKSNFDVVKACFDYTILLLVVSITKLIFFINRQRSKIFNGTI